MRRIAVLVALLALLGLAAPATAAQQIGLSWDGTTWSTQLTGTLFNRAGSIQSWVPGDSDSESFYVRNQGGDAAQLKVEYDLPPNTLVNDTDFEVTASIDGAAPVVLTPGTDWLPVGDTRVANGGVAHVAVTATFRWTSPNHSMDEVLPIDFRVTLSELAGAPPGTDESSSPEASPSPVASFSPTSGPSAGAGAPGTDTTPSAAPGQEHGAGAPDTDTGSSGPHLGGLLPDTGAPEIGWLLGLAVVCLGGGLLIVVRSRRKERDGDAR
jgi:hypothetical protein